MSVTAQRQYDLIRQRPFTLLAFALVSLVLAAGIAFCALCSESTQQLYRNGGITALLSLPAIALLAAIWKKEKKTPYPLPVRRVAWNVMFGIYVCMFLGGLAVALFLDAQMNRRIAVLASLAMFVPTGIFFFDLLRGKGV